MPFVRGPSSAWRERRTALGRHYNIHRLWPRLCQRALAETAGGRKSGEGIQLACGQDTLQRLFVGLLGVERYSTLTGGCAGCAHSPESVQLVSCNVLSTFSACRARRMQHFDDECVMRDGNVSRMALFLLKYRSEHFTLLCRTLGWYTCVGENFLIVCHVRLACP